MVVPSPSPVLYNYACSEVGSSSDRGTLTLNNFVISLVCVMNPKVFSDTLISKSPSNIIASLFLSLFLENERRYLHAIEQVTVGRTISFDHTFKIAANIGYSRSDGVWVTQYDSMFIVMNQEGKIIKWQFTKGTSLEQVRTIL